MTYPYFKPGIEPNVKSIPADQIPTLERTRLEDPAGYIPHPDLSHAVNVSLVLGMPLLVTGQPGTGKTQLASAVAYALGCAIHKFETKSTSIAKDLFYTFDALSAFKAKPKGDGDVDQRHFIRFQALGRAILDAFEAGNERVARLLPPIETDYKHAGPRRSVVLIDEIDKAPRDFPNDLLNEIDRLYFRVPELENFGTPGADDGEAGVAARYRPIVIMTSNSEKGLPDAFLRRCVYFDIPFPLEAAMRDIVQKRVEGIGGSDTLLNDALDLFYSLRREKGATNLKKEPATAELLNWMQILLHRDATPTTSLKAKPALVVQTLSTLVKNTDDRHQAIKFVNDSWAKAT